MSERRHQLNVNITSDLLSAIKKTARKRGVTIGEFITELALKEIGEAESENLVVNSLNERITTLESELLSLKRSCPGQEQPQQIKVMPFTQKETENCTDFMRALFKKVINKRKIKKSIIAWNDFLPHVEKFKEWTPSLTIRLKEVLLFEDPEPWSAEELNNLTKNKQCPCPVREALVSWTNSTDIPDQQTICNEGKSLVDSLL